MIRLIRSELLKIRTTHMWWIFALSALVLTGLAFWANSYQVHDALHREVPQDLPPGIPPDEAEQIRQQAAEERAKARTAAGLAQAAANVYTSGQYFGLLFVMLLGILVITNEFYHQTATTTFLTTPHRTLVITSKLATAVAVGTMFWLVTTALNVGAGTVFFSTEHVTNSLGAWEVTRALLLNLLAYALWAIFGVGLGVLLRSQIGATVTASVLYLIGTQVAFGVLFLLHTWIKKDWVLQSAVLLPSIASQHMITGVGVGGDVRAWPRWVGAVVLVGYAVVAGGVGTLITRKRDIS